MTPQSPNSVVYPRHGKDVHQVMATMRECIGIHPSVPSINDHCLCQVWVYSGRGSGQVQTKMDEGRGQRAGQEVSPAGVGDRLDSMTKDKKH